MEISELYFIRKILWGLFIKEWRQGVSAGTSKDRKKGRRGGIKVSPGEADDMINEGPGWKHSYEDLWKNHVTSGSGHDRSQKSGIHEGKGTASSDAGRK